MTKDQIYKQVRDKYFTCNSIPECVEPMIDHIVDLYNKIQEIENKLKDKEDRVITYGSIPESKL